MRDARTNRRIRAREVRVIGAQGEQLGILTIEAALAASQEAGLDLVEISPTAKPPVCKIMDYGKFKYDEKKRAAQARKKQFIVQVKEVKLRPKTDEHDYDFKVRNVRRFLEEGNKAKLTLMFRGREIVHKEIGQAVLMKVVGDLKDLAVVEQTPRMEGRQMFMILAPNPKHKAKPAAAPSAPKPPSPAAPPRSMGASPSGAPELSPRSAAPKP
ncbi:MAG: translation initiation factor IF-3 [Myxococcales bacterium]